MTVLLTGDLHLTDNPRDAYRWEFLRWTLPELLKDHAVDHLYVLGDLTEQKDYHSAWLVNNIVECFHKLARPLKGITILCGNHDYASAAHPFFAFLKRIEKMSWVGEPTELGKWLFLPHTDKYKEHWRDEDFSRYQCVFAHQTFAGARVGTRTYEGIPTNIFAPGVKVYSGDIHTPQSFGPITYVGAPYLCDFGDDYEPRVILLEGNKEKSIPVPGPQKRLVDIHFGDRLPDNLFERDIIKVRVQVSASEMEKWPGERDRIREWATKRKLELWLIVPTLDPADRKRMRTAIRNADKLQTDEELVSAYAKVKRVSERTLKTGLWIMEQQ